jgi:hypothetical protein
VKYVTPNNYRVLLGFGSNGSASKQLVDPPGVIPMDDAIGGSCLIVGMPDTRPMIIMELSFFNCIKGFVAYLLNIELDAVATKARCHVGLLARLALDRCKVPWNIQ